LLNFSRIKINDLIEIVDIKPRNKFLGNLILSSCPGIGKNLLNDIETIKELKIDTLFTLIDDTELNDLGGKGLSQLLKINHIKWLQLPITNFSIPEKKQKEVLINIIEELIDDLINNRNILIHCMAGLGRSGMIAATILKKIGINAQLSISTIRSARPGAIETTSQVDYIVNF
tara:strand:+ start:365 stop:883 length:519 start_codon:yes stop_codon:yes gene_type:complete